MRTITVDLSLILELVSCAETYGYNKSILLSGFAEMIDELTDSDIEQYVNKFLTPEFLQQGYGQEDVDSVRETLQTFRSQYLT